MLKKLNKAICKILAGKKKPPLVKSTRINSKSSKLAIEVNAAPSKELK